MHVKYKSGIWFSPNTQDNTINSLSKYNKKHFDRLCQESHFRALDVTGHSLVVRAVDLDF